MKGKFGKRSENYIDSLTNHQADILLKKIIADSKPGKATALSGNYFKVAVIACGIILVLMFLAPGTVAPAPISNISPAQGKTSGSATVDFQVNSLIPLRGITARMNDKDVAVTQNSYQGYSVEVHENGYLLLEVETLTGMSSSQNILIDSVDNEAPQVVSHEQSSTGITIYLSDGEGTGVDYGKITGRDADTSETVLPAAYSESEGYVIFEYPKSAIYIEIPDKAGNKLTSILQPVN